jgi:hypothetical protein
MAQNQETRTVRGPAQGEAIELDQTAPALRGLPLPLLVNALLRVE